MRLFLLTGRSSSLGAHYFYTIFAVGLSLPVRPLVLLASTNSASQIVALWAWYDFYIKAAQPYLDLARGEATASRSLLLNYLAEPNVLVPFYAGRNGHYLAVVSALGTSPVMGAS